MTEENKTQKSDVAKKEEDVLKFWQENKIFEKSLEKEASNGSFTFYDGPPFATGLPHYGHILAGTMKDIIPRYQTMKGKKVERRWGWDCHGLPIENLIEDELGLKTKKDIYEHGIDEFNQAAKDSVLRYDTDWKKIVPRTGRWVDMENSYKSMDTSYSESIWWIFKNIYDKKLIYEGHKAMHLCPRCETTLSNFEVNQGYKDIKDLSATAKFELLDPVKSGFAGKTFVLAWTTTPWTLPGNVALAVNPNIEYSRVEVEGVGYVVAKELVNKVFGDEIKITYSVSGKGLIDAEYKPLFDYYAKDENLENQKNGWKIYDADFVTTEEGTGIVHIAPAFGSDDMELGREKELPFVQHVTVDGKFTEEVKDFAGAYVKPKQDHMATDIEIIKYLAHNDLLFSKEKIEHSYPHCWRCDTPLLNYATSSWFLKVTGIKDKLLKANSQINWVPEHIKDGRFGKWLEGARDWAISRTRFWGAPLPVWKCEECDEVEVLGSIDDLKERTKGTNNYFVMRHGEADSNVEKYLSTKEDNPDHLTEKGKEQVAEAVGGLKGKKIDLVIASPFVRTKETAEIVSEGLGLKKDQLIFDDRIKEIDAGEYNNKSIKEYSEYFKSWEEKFKKNAPGGENMTEVKNRAGDFLYDIDKKYSGKNILIVTHGAICWAIASVSRGLNAKESADYRDSIEGPYFAKNAEVKELDFAPISHNKNYESDLHMPYIDEVKIDCKCGKEMKRIPEVFDCWFESGAMPYASHHYPFENLDKFDPEKGIGFPADFIAEGTDQTRGWFYTSLVLSTALFEQTSFNNVIVNGMVMAEDGKKMSKSLKNYPEVGYILDKYGADAMRYYMISSPIVRAEDLNFSEKGVDEILKKIILKTKNVYSFYELYKDNLDEKVDPKKSENVLDQWILARLNELIEETTESLDKYELDRASRPFLDFVEDLSTWYVRRSRDRFKGEDQKDKDFAIETTRFVLQESLKVMAPFMPFFTEELWQSLRDTQNNAEQMQINAEKDLSVHLQDWPEVDQVDEKVLEEMKRVREIVSLALEKRAEVGIKVRQPLKKLIAYSSQLTGMNEKLVNVIEDEVNVKEVVFETGDEEKVELDIELDEELKAEGNFRELLRNIQRMRKEAKLVPSDMIELEIETSKEGRELVEKFKDELTRVAGVKEIEFEDADDGEEIKIDDLEFKIEIDD